MKKSGVKCKKSHIGYPNYSSTVKRLGRNRSREDVNETEGEYTDLLTGKRDTIGHYDQKRKRSR